MTVISGISIIRSSSTTTTTTTTTTIIDYVIVIVISISVSIVVIVCRANVLLQRAKARLPAFLHEMDTTSGADLN